MSVSCGMECVVVLGCLRWAWKRCTYIGSYDSATWTTTTAEEFEPVPRVCRVILAVYEEDLRNPKFAPAGGYGMNPDWVVKRVTYEQTQGHAPPYMVYADHDHREIVLAIRGLNLVKDSDYKLLLNNRLGMLLYKCFYFDRKEKYLFREQLQQQPIGKSVLDVLEEVLLASGTSRTLLEGCD